MALIKSITAKSVTYDIGADSSNISYSSTVSVRDKINAAVASAEGVHGFRYYNDELQYYNTTTNEQTTIETGGGGVALGDVSGAAISISHKIASFTQTDPEDLVVSGVTIAQQAGTKIVRKAGSAPTSVTDGTLVANVTTRNQYSSTPITDETNRDQNTLYYYRFFPYTTQDVATPGTSLSGTFIRETVNIPSPSATLNYNGTEQTMTFTDYDTSIMSGTGLSGTAASNYTATFIMTNDDYIFSNNTQEVNVSWSIEKTQLAVPTTQETLTYNGSEQTQSFTDYDSTQLDATGITGTNAGSYTAIFTPKTGYCWTDMTEVSKEVSWSIAKADATATLSATEVTLDSDHLTVEVTMTDPTGTVGTITSNDTTVASVSVSNNIITISNVNQKSGNATISIPIAGDDNYNNNTLTISVIASFLSIVTQAAGTDEQIKAMLDAYYADTISWSDMGQAVGDTRLGHFNAMTAPNPDSSNTQVAQDIILVIVDYEHTDLATSINGHTKACITVQTRECMSGTSAGTAGTIYVNGDSSYDTTFTKQSNLYMRTYLNSTVLTSIPEGDFKSAIKESNHYRHTTYNGSTSEQVTDTLFLPSYPEIFGTASYSYYAVTNPTEGTQFRYYQTSTNRVKYVNNNGSSSGSTTYWQQGSASSYYHSGVGYYWCRVHASGEANDNNGSGARGVAPAFAM